MNINGHHYRTIWIKEEDPKVVRIINQQLLPHRFEILDLTSVEDFRHAIKEMYIRGAGLIGAAAGYGIYIAALTSPQIGYREYIWKAYDYEEALDRAYKLGREDERRNVNENVEAASFEGGETTVSAPIKREKGESNQSLLKRLYTHHLKTRRGS